MDVLQKTLAEMWKIVLFIIVSVIFLPAWLIVTNLEKSWSKQFDSLFG